MIKKTLHWTAAGCLILGLAGNVWAQGSRTASSNVPVVASGQLPSSTPTSNAELANTYTLGLTAGTHFDDNAVVNAHPRQWDLGYVLFPSVEFTEIRPRLDWSVRYAPGVDISQNLLYKDHLSQQLNGHFAWMVSPHGLLSAQEYFIVTTDPFRQLGGTASPGPTIAPNEGPFIPNLRRTSTLTNALYSYRLTEHSSFGIGGNFMISKFDNTPKHGPTTTLINSQRSSGEAYFNHQFSQREALGVQYGIQVLRFPRFDARTTSHTILIFDQLTISPRSTFTIYGGPEYADTFNQVVLNLGLFVLTIPVKSQQWSGAGGVLYNWTGDRLGLTLDFKRGVSDGGGLVGAVELNSGQANISWRLSRRWTLESTLGGSSSVLLATQTNQGLLTYSERVQLSQLITHNLSMHWFYGRLNQTGGFGTFPVANHDFAGASLTYSVQRPIGR